MGFGNFTCPPNVQPVDLTPKIDWTGKTAGPPVFPIPTTTVAPTQTVIPATITPTAPNLTGFSNDDKKLVEAAFAILKQKGII